MKKEGMVAIFFGILLGLTVAVVMVWRIRGSESIKGQIQTNNPTPAVRKDATAADNTLTVSQPANGFITNGKNVSIKGTVQKGSVIVAQSPLTEKIMKSDKETYEISFPLAIGENIILVAAYPDDKTIRPQQKTVTVYYLDEQ